MRRTTPRDESSTSTLCYSLTIVFLLLITGLFPANAVAQVPSGTWSPMGSMATARTGASATLLQDGRVMITGGADASGMLDSAELYGGSFSAADSMLLARRNHASVTLQDGRVLVVGGSTAAGPTNETEIYDPSIDTWTVGNPMAASRSGPTATLLTDGRVLIAGGTGAGAPGTTLEIFDPSTGAFSLAGSLSASRANHAAALLADGRVLITGGFDGSSTLNSTDIYDPSTGTVASGPSMSTARAFHTATTLLNGDVLIAGGNNGSTDLSSAEIFSAATGFVGTGTLGSARSGQSAFLLPNNNSVLIVGGSAPSAELYRPWSGSFVPTGAPSVSRNGGVGSTLGVDGLFLMAGGTDSSAELYGFATVKTDKADYHPGEVATFTGYGWQPGETVTLTIVESPLLDTHGPYTAVADANGRISNHEFVPDQYDVSVHFYLTAVGASSTLEAQTMFSDSGSLSYSPSTQSLNALAGGTSVSFVQTVTAPSKNGSFTANLQVAGTGANPIPASWVSTSPALLSFTTTPSAGDIKSWTVSFTVPSGTTAGTYTANIKANPPSGVGVGPGTGVTLFVSANTAPAVVVNNSSMAVDEGQTAANTGTYSDGNSGDNVIITASIGAILKTGTNSGTWSWSFGATDGPAESQTVTITADDQNGGVTTTTFGLTVNNVAPAATFIAPASVDEGTPIGISLTSPSDPSSVDTTATFTYAFDCGSGYSSFSASATANCPTTDNGTRTVKGKIRDKDHGETEYTASVTVNNVAPTASLTNDGPINEGGSATITFAGQTDPSSTDTAAGFHYAFDCANGSLATVTYANTGSAATTTCSFDDNGLKTVRARIIDKDDGFTEYTTSVTVNNVAPTATLAGPNSANEGDSKTYSFSSASDPSSADTAEGFHYAYDCNGGSLSAAAYGTSGTAASTNCTFVDNGSNTVRARIIDKDDGFTEYTVTVSVANVAPTAALANNGPVDEGSPATITFSNQFDPSSADTSAGFHYAYSCTGGDLSASTYAAESVSNASSACTFEDNGSYTVKARIIDKDDGFAEYTTIVTVNNVAPKATLSNDGPIDEGNSATINFTGASDPSSVDTTAGFRYSFSCDGNAASLVATYAAAGTTATISCPFGDNGSFTVAGRIFDKDNGYSDYTTTVVVNNVAPKATFNTPASVDEGSAISLSLTNPQDVAADLPSLTYAFDCGTGAGLGPYTATSTASCAAINDPNQTVIGSIKDKDGGHREYPVPVIVINIAPTLTTAAVGTPINENGTTTLTGNFTDPGSLDIHTVVIQWGDGNTQSVLLGQGDRFFSATHQYLDDDPTGTASDNYSVAVTVQDNSGGISGTLTRTIVVNNVAPEIGASANIGVPVLPMAAPATASISVSVPFTDVGTLDTHTCTINFDDTTSLAGTILPGSSTCTYTGNHVFSAAGIYTISANIKDDDSGEVSYFASSLVVVYDPAAGFVTGGGWINSPFGAYVADPGLAGKANFGFVSRYQKGANVPTGETEFNFNVASFKFHSTSYQWLVVSGSRAQYKGTGTVNGAGNYGFLLTAVDGGNSGDGFRIKIWDINAGGTIVYDNMFGTTDDPNNFSPMALGGGSITIHK